MKKTKQFLVASLVFLVIICVTDVASATTWGVSTGDELKYEATKYTDNQFIIDQTVTMTVEFSVTFVDDYVNADMSEDGGTAFSVFMNTQSLDDDFGINIRSSNGINIRYIADEQRFQAQMTQIDNTIGAVLANYSMSRVGNSLTISAYGGGSGTSWTYDAEIHYSSSFVLTGMSEDHFQTDGVNDAVQTIDWTLVYHNTSTTTPTSPTTSPTTPAPTGPAPALPMPVIIGAAGIVAVVVVVVIIRRR